MPSCAVCLEPRHLEPLAAACQAHRHAICAACVTTAWALRVADGADHLGCPGCAAGAAAPPLAAKLERSCARRFLTAAQIEALLANRRRRTSEQLRLLIATNAELLHWARDAGAQTCPRCFALVARSEGCSHMTCVCGAEFCYDCGAEYGTCDRARSCVRHLNLRGLGELDAAAHPSAARTSTAATGAASKTDSTAVESRRIVGHLAAAAVAARSSITPAAGPADELCAECNEGVAVCPAAAAAVGADAAAAGPAAKPWAECEEGVARAARVAPAELLDALLTLRCPQCALPVAMARDFSECFSLRCGACSASMCAWCLHDTSGAADAHTHVLDCAHAPLDMRGHSLYLAGTGEDGEPAHTPPRPFLKFDEHWRQIGGAIVARTVNELNAFLAEAVDAAPALTSTLQTAVRTYTRMLVATHASIQG